MRRNATRIHILKCCGCLHPAMAAPALLLYCLTAVAFAATSNTLFRNVTPLDAHSGAGAVQDVLIADGKITSMGQALDAPAGTRIVDGRGRFLIPGLWDMHVHLSYDDRLSDSMGDLFLDYGITSVRDTGGQLDVLLPIVKKIRTSDAAAPRVFYAGPLLDGSPVVYNGQGVPSLGTSNTVPESASLTVQALTAAGASFIKIYEMVSPEMFQALVAAAKTKGIPVAAHVPLSMLASEAGPEAQSLEHLRNLELDCAADADKLLRQRQLALLNNDQQSGLALRRNIHATQRSVAFNAENPARCDQVIARLTSTIQVPTARLTAMTQYPPFAATDWDAALAGLPDAVRDDWQNAAKRVNQQAYRTAGTWALGMIPRLAAAGVPIGAGTDTPIGWSIPGYSLHRELQVLVAAGLEPIKALKAATIVPAQFFGLHTEMGQVAVGFGADLLLLDANPLDDIANTRSIRMVMAHGSIVREAQP
ncbi:MAG: amidohydrolase family protein [Congregibacter sp.]